MNSVNEMGGGLTFIIAICFFVCYNQHSIREEN
jgi:hypothetical protein